MLGPYAESKLGASQRNQHHRYHRSSRSARASIRIHWKCLGDVPAAWSTIWSVYPTWPYFGNGLMYAFSPWSGHYTGIRAPTSHHRQFILASSAGHSQPDHMDHCPHDSGAPSLFSPLLSLFLAPAPSHPKSLRCSSRSRAGVSWRAPAEVFSLKADHGSHTCLPPLAQALMAVRYRMTATEDLSLTPPRAISA
jgi:hypothetical protein